MAPARHVAVADQPLDRAIALLGTLAAQERALSLTELAAICRYPVPTVHRLVGQLELRGLVKRAIGSRKVLIGPALVQLAAAAMQAALKADPAHQVLVTLAGELGEPCHIGVRSADEIVYVDSASTRPSVGLHFEQGQRAPLHCTSIGKLFLADLSDAVLDAWLARSVLPRYSSSTIVSRPRLKAVIAEVRKRQWASSIEEFAPGVVGCAVPVRFDDGRLIAGLGVSAPSARTPMARLRSFVPKLKEAARLIARTAA